MLIIYVYMMYVCMYVDMCVCLCNVGREFHDAEGIYI